MSPENNLFNKEFYDKMMEVHSDMRHLREWAIKHDENDKAVHERLDARTKSLENDRMKVMGGASVLGFLGGLVTKWLMRQ
jgi:hypothetical protein